MTINTDNCVKPNFLQQYPNTSKIFKYKDVSINANNKPIIDSKPVNDSMQSHYSRKYNFNSAFSIEGEREKNSENKRSNIKIRPHSNRTINSQRDLSHEKNENKKIDPYLSKSFIVKINPYTKKMEKVLKINTLGNTELSSPRYFDSPRMISSQSKYFLKFAKNFL